MSLLSQNPFKRFPETITKTVDLGNGTVKEFTIVRGPVEKKMIPRTVFLGKGLPPPGRGGQDRDLKNDKAFDSWYKENMEGEHFKKDIKSLIKGNIVETKHSRVAPLILTEQEFATFKKKYPSHNYIKADTLGILNDQEMQRLQSTKSKSS